MTSRVSSLIVRLTDEVTGPAGKAAGSLKQLGNAGKSLGQVAQATPEVAKLARELDHLKGSADRLGQLKGAASGLDALGVKMRRASAETERAARDLAAAEKRVAFFQRSKASGSDNYAGFVASGLVAEAEARLKVAKRVHAAAERQMAATRVLYVEQKREVRALAAGIAGAATPLRTVAAAETALAAAAGTANAAIARQPALFSLASARATGLARSYRDLAAGMSASGRQMMANIEASRRMVAGMSAPAQAAAAAAAARRQSELRQDYRQGRRYASGSMAGGAPHEGAGVVDTLAGAGAAEMARRTYEKARDGYLEMDEATRRQQAVLQIDVTKQRPLYEQALRIGQDTRFSNADVVKAQTRIGSSLPDHLKTAGLIRAVTDNAKDYALAMGTTMDEASSAILGRMLAMSYDMSSPDAAATSSRHAANRLVQFAKSSGADHNDIMGYTKFGAAPGQVGGFSEEFADALGAQLRRIGYEGAMAGNFVRAAATKLAVPTDKGRAVMAANDIDHDDYVEPSKRMSSEGLDNVVRLKFGKGLTASQSKRIAALMQDEDVVGSREEFVPQVSTILQETLAKRGRKGKINAQDAAKIAKVVNEYMTATAGATDIERLMRDLVAKGLTPAMAKYLFGQEHGGRAQGLKLDTLNKDQETFRTTPNDRAAKIGADINAGFYGAYQRMIGSIETLYMRLAQVNDGPLTRFYDRVGNAVDAVSNLPDPVIAFGTQVAAAGAALLTLKGTLGALSLLGVTTATTVSRALGRLVPQIAALEAGRQAGTALGETINEVGAIAAGKHWTPQDSDDMRERRGALAQRADETEARVHPSRRGEFNPEIDLLRRQVQDLDNRIRSGEERRRAGLKLGEAAREALENPKPPADAPAAKAVPLPPVRPPEFGALARAAEEAGQDAGRAIVGGIEAQSPAAGRAGVEAGESAGRGVARGIEQAAPEAEEKARTLWERIKGLFAEGVHVPIHLDAPGAGAARAVKASWVSLPAEPSRRAGPPSGRRTGSRSGGAGATGPGPAVSPEAEFGSDVNVARLPAGMRNNNPGNIKFTRVGAFGSVIGPSRNTDQGDPQAVFANAEDGMRALVDLARRKWEGGRQTVNDLVAARGGWTPGNRQAAANIARGAGVAPGQRIDLSDEAAMQRFVRALITQEHGPASRLYSDAMIRRAIRPREATPPTGLNREDAASALKRVQDRYAPPASPETAPGLTRAAPAAPPAGGSSGGSIAPQAGGARDTLATLDGMRVAPAVDASGLDGLIAKGQQAIGVLRQVASAAAAAGAASVASSAAAGPAPSTGAVRRTMSNTYA